MKRSRTFEHSLTPGPSNGISRCLLAVLMLVSSADVLQAQTARPTRITVAGTEFDVSSHEHDAAIVGLVFTEEKRLVWGDVNKNVPALDVATMKKDSQQQRMGLGPGKLASLAYNRQKMYLAAGGTGKAGGEVTVRNRDGKTVLLDVGGGKSPVKALAFSADGEKLAATTSIWTEGAANEASACIAVWKVDASSRAPEKYLHGRNGEADFSVVAFRPDSLWLGAGSSKGLTVWSLEKEKPTLFPLQEKGEVRALGFSLAFMDGKAAIAWGGQVTTDEGQHGFLALTSSEGGASAEPRTLRLAGVTDPVTCLAFDPAGRLLAAGSGSSVLLWLTHRQPKPHRLLAPGSVTSIAFSPNGKIMAACSGKTITIWAAVEK